MPISCQCASCGAKMNVADKFAGKRAKCPKCGQPIDIPAAPAAQDSLFGDDLSLAAETPRTPPAKSAGWGASAKDPRSHLDSLLDEMGVEAAVSGPTCPSCNSSIDEGALICINCGFNFQTGERVYSQVRSDPNAARSQMSEADKIMAKAEAEIAVNPISQEDQGYGDGPESFFLAAGALLVGALLVAAIVGIVVLFDKLTESSGMMVIVMLCIATVLMMIGQIWITIAAFKESVGQGLAIFTLLYIPVFGFLRGKDLWVPTMCWIMGVAAAVTAAVNYFYAATGT